MSIVRTSHNKNNPYVMLNKCALEDRNLSWQAKGLWSYLMSRPDDWKVSVSHLSTIYEGKGGGERAIYSLLNELMDKGYCTRSQSINDKGQFKSYDYTIQEFKNLLPDRSQADAAEPHAAESPPTNKRNILSNEKNQQQEAPPPKRAKPAVAASFDKLNKKQKLQKLEDLGVPGILGDPKNQHYECLTSVDIPDKEKAWLTKKYDEDTVKQAIEYCTHPDVTIETTLIQTLKWACKNKPKLPEKKMTPYEELSQTFKHYELYNEAYCFIDENSISFERGMKHITLLFQYFTWDKFDEMCGNFGFRYDRTEKRLIKLPRHG